MQHRLILAQRFFGTLTAGDIVQIDFQSAIARIGVRFEPAIDDARFSFEMHVALLAQSDMILLIKFGPFPLRKNIPEDLTDKLRERFISEYQTLSHGVYFDKTE